MFRYLLIVFLFFINLSTYGDENQRSLKQQLDRLQRDVNDLSKLVYKKNIHDIEDKNEVESINSINISAFDMRIYDLEKDIKNLNSSYEDLVFEIDEIKDLINSLDLKISDFILTQKSNLDSIEIENSSNIYL